MKLAPEHQKDFAAMPAALRKLLEAELAAGNEIIEVSHCFPAPPAGAYFKLAKPVSTRPRESGDDIHFYNRDNSSYAGEFTDAKRFYFILEPPYPPPPYPDMDAIRKAAEGTPTALTQLAQRQPGSGLEIGKELLRERFTGPSAESAGAPRRALTSTETATGAERVLHFLDKRPPQEIQFALERDLMTLFVPTMDNGKLNMKAEATVVGAHYFFELRFEAALLLKNCYSLRVETSWAKQAATHDDFYRKTSDSWFSFWTRDFMAANPPAAAAGSAARYQKLCNSALKAEARLDTVPALQQTIVAAMKQGASFATAHKEGGTNIRWLNGIFVLADYGESEERKEFSNEAKFLTALRQFYDWETSKNVYPDKVSDFVAWKLILRLLRSK